MNMALQSACAQDIEASSKYCLDIRGLSKTFKRQTISKANYTTIKSALLSAFSKTTGRKQNVTHAVRDLTLRIPQGASVGVIGRNGSGKSTLLKLITGIYKPEVGTIHVNGRVAALIELGAGFHPDFTGRENLYLAGVMHGLSRSQIDQRYDQIVDFADLKDVIDDPVRTYSSGMYMRLGFSLAVHTDPDILLVDEVLAVGDAAFVAKCKDRLSTLRKAGKTLLLVTHDLAAVERWCDEALWLDAGRVMDRGDPRRVIDHYRQFVEKREELELQEQSESKITQKDLEDGRSAEEERGRWGSREVEITAVRLLNQLGEDHLVFHPSDSMQIEITYNVRDRISDIVFGIAVNRSDGLPIYGSNTDIERVEVPQLSSNGTVVYRLNRIGLLEGAYSVDVAVHRSDGYPFDYHKGVHSFKIRSAYKQVGVVSFEGEWRFSNG
ncbi:MAG: ABC transporter ATP-binding protein [Bdellovibrionales bacterium]|nr:ABC transporter ATP-binding protein [Bdellovibrionales bacterium]